MMAETAVKPWKAVHDGRNSSQALEKPSMMAETAGKPWKSHP